LGEGKVRRLNFLTDDPWNPAHRADWFLRSLRHYDVVFTPRHANAAQLAEASGADVRYLPFAYAPKLHYAEPPADDAERLRFDTDVVFVGSADAAREAWLTAVSRAGIAVAAYGAYWDRNSETRAFARGYAGPDIIRKATCGARLTLGLVRAANRDGHSMRTYEAAAMGACILAQDTTDHRALFGRDGEAVAYFREPADLVATVRRLLEDPAARERMGRSAMRVVRSGPNTYSDRLTEMLSHLGPASP
jgi:glycosyltransferase involved in cell wall biosynthesis